MASISAYENGSKVPPTPTLIKMAETCDCSIDWLFGLRDDSTAGNEEPAAKTYSDYIKRLFALDDGSVSLWFDACNETDPCTETARLAILFTDSVLKAVSKQYDSDMDEFAKVQQLSKETGTEIPAPIAALESKTVRFQNVCTPQTMSDELLKLLNLQ